MKLQSIREQIVQPIFVINLVLNIEMKEILEVDEDNEINTDKNTGEKFTDNKCKIKDEKYYESLVVRH